MSKKKIILFLIILVLTISVSGCIYEEPTNNPGSDITNKVTNEITQTIVDYNGNITIEDLEDSVTTTVKMVENAVIGVSLKRVTEKTIGGKKYTFEDYEALGSGVIYKRIDNKNSFGEIDSYSYYVITNAHIIVSDDKTTKHTVYAYLGYYNTECKAEVLGYDEKLDLAVLKFSSYYYIDPVEFQDQSKLEKGNFVIAVGNPNGYDHFGSVTFGIISDLNCYHSFDTDGDGNYNYMGEYIQIDAAINSGNSGGGLFTLDGKLAGIPSIRKISENAENMSFAIPINVIKIAIEEYLEKGLEIIKPKLGVIVIPVTEMNSDIMIQEGIYEFPDIYNGERPYGFYISSFAESGSLVNQGIHEKDIILTFGGNKLYQNSQLSSYLNSIGQYKIGSVVEITYYCNKTGKIETINITLTSGE